MNNTKNDFIKMLVEDNTVNHNVCTFNQLSKTSANYFLLKC